ncbi:MAG: 2-C-methyl-D-erythritol 4-phosphate cytidylyltransferase [Deltaproteobacteria bacterium]
MGNNLRVVIAAAGIGSRMGSKINKQYLNLNSRPILTYSLNVFEDFKAVDEIVIVAHARDVEYCEKEVVKKYGYRKISRVIAGGEMRQDSVWAGLQCLDKKSEYVAVHDGARPLFTSHLLEDLLEEAREWGAAIPGLAARDTMKMVDRDGFVTMTLDRASVVSIQTPQIFSYPELYQAYASAYEEGYMSTDDAALFEKYIGRVKIVPGEYRNIKITTPEDLVVAASLIDM